MNCRVSLRIIWLPEFIFETRQISYSGWKYQFPSLTLSLLLCCRDKKSGSNFRIYDSYSTALFPLQFSHCFIFNWIFLQSSWKTLTKSHSFFLYKNHLSIFWFCIFWEHLEAILTSFTANFCQLVVNFESTYKRTQQRKPPPKSVTHRQTILAPNLQITDLAIFS